MDKATFLELMDQYIDGTMSSAEKFDFEQMLKRDPLLQEEFELHKSIRKGIKISARKDLLSELNEIKKEINPNVHNVRSLFSRWTLSIAAVLIFIFGLLFIFRSELIYKEKDFANKKSSTDKPYVVDNYKVDSKSDTNSNWSERYSSKSTAYYKKVDTTPKKKFVEYAGKFDFKILPMQGKLGSPINQKIDLVLKPFYLNEYLLEEDTLFIFAVPDVIIKIHDSIVLITLNQERNIVLETKEQTFIFKKKSE